MIVLPSPVPGMIIISVSGRGYYLNANQRWRVGDTLQADDISRYFLQDPLLGVPTCASEMLEKQFQYALDHSNTIFTITVKYMSDGSKLPMRHVSR
jgi:hypothetical protein